MPEAWNDIALEASDEGGYTVLSSGVTIGRVEEWHGRGWVAFALKCSLPIRWDATTWSCPSFDTPEGAAKALRGVTR